MDVTKSLDIPFTLKRLICLVVYLQTRVLGFLLKKINWLLPFEILRSLRSWLTRKGRELNAIAGRLPPVLHNVAVQQVVTPVNGGVELHGDLYLPVSNKRDEKFPVILIRTPYDKESPLLGGGLATVFAERGFACLVQDTRGRFGSGGDFFPVAHEVNDGKATVQWLRAQPWCNGKIGTFGISYLGLTAYAAANDNGVDACVPIMASSRLYPILYNGGSSFALDLVIRWLWLVMNVMMEKNPIKKVVKVLTSARQLEPALRPKGSKPIHHRDYDIVGQELAFFREVCHAHDLDHDFWTEKDVLCDMTKSAVATTIVAGWYDFFVAQSFKDFEDASRVTSSAPLKIICGPWSHWGFASGSAIAFNSALELFDAMLKSSEIHYQGKIEGGGSRPTEVIVHVLHSESKEHSNGKWLKFQSWPPKQHRDSQFFLASAGRLSDSPSKEDSFTEQLYDPEFPTPHLGGPNFDWLNSGRVEQTSLEMRDDVSVFTSPSLSEELLICGNVGLKLCFWSSNPHTDIFVKICDFNPQKGTSMNVMEKLTRLSPAKTNWDTTGKVTLEIDLGPIAVMFKKGNCVRIQVSGGAHPAYLRNSGTPDLASLHLEKARRKILHSHSFQSCLRLPVISSNREYDKV